MSPSVIVLGSSGQLASELKFVTESAPEYLFLGKDQFDVNHPDSLFTLLRQVKPKTVINCAAYTATDKAESDVSACELLNTEFPKRLAEMSAKLDFHVVHFSTDFVFSGKVNRPYTEVDDAEALNVYGRTKREGEIAVTQNAKSASIVRTSWLYSEFGNNFVKTMTRLAQGPAPLRVVVDQFGSPTWARDLARATIRHFAVPTGKTELYHFANYGSTTWYDFAKEICRLQGIEKEIKPIPSSEFVTAALKPAYGVLDTSKYRNRFSEPAIPWRESLAECLDSNIDQMLKGLLTKK